jgi:hypothetical protein
MTCAFSFPAMPARSRSAPTRSRWRWQAAASKRGTRHRDRAHRLARPVLAGADDRGRDAARPRRLRPGDRPTPSCSTRCSPGGRIRCGSADRGDSLAEAPDPADLRPLRRRRPALARGLSRPWRLQGPRARADAGRRTRSSPTSRQSGLRGRGGAGFPTGIKWKTVAQTQRRPEIHRLQRRRRRQRHLRRPHDHGRRSLRLIEGMTIAGIAVGATKGYVYIRSEYPHAVEAMNAAIAIARGARLSRRASRLGAQLRSSKSASAPAPMSAARRPRCWKAWKASAAGARQAAAAGA